MEEEMQYTHDEIVDMKIDKMDEEVVMLRRKIRKLEDVIETILKNDRFIKDKRCGHENKSDV